MSIQGNRRLPVKKKRDYRNALRMAGRSFLGIVVVAGLTLAGVGLNRAFRVDHWHISGVDPALAHAIEHQLTQMGPMDFIHSRPASLRERLVTAIPDLAAISISRHLPHSLEIKATARVPVAFWQGPQKGIWLVDSKGLAYRKLQPDEHYDLPLLRMPGATLGQAVALLQTMQKIAPERCATLSEFIVRSNAWKMDFDHGQSWLLPRGDKAVRDLHKLVALMHSSRLQGGNWKVDARMDTRWFIRKAGEGGVV